ncbi:hypothetical protein PPTG_23806 [Phytophthora nicotianae INRA-310]|uniref:Uncharacterized protein n=3 Tax=Phytophthora nicotianae TaxID=4792 RepID=W2PRF5_PHYN3|nr:hypothetical protein PPTG_23806 [Phytophthora nicotianae INRA-310]ETN03558.1 hypothetical protein PPTG_23806 [Phytophthora nicotianae INRA-310]
MPSSESIVASTRQSLSSFSTVSQEVESSPSTTRVSINNITFRNPQEKPFKNRAASLTAKSKPQGLEPTSDKWS